MKEGKGMSTYYEFYAAIGAIKLNQRLELIDQFDIYVKPQAYCKMLKEITQITRIRERRFLLRR